MDVKNHIDYLLVDKKYEKEKPDSTHSPQFNIYENENSSPNDNRLPHASFNSNNKFLSDLSHDSSNNRSDNDDSQLLDAYDTNLSKLHFNVSNKKYFPPPSEQKSYLIPKVMSYSLAIKNIKSINNIYALDFGLSETISYKTKFPHSVSYERLCPQDPPYISPLLIELLCELEQHIPPISKITSGSSQQTLESADALFDTMLTVNISNGIPQHIAQIFFLNVSVKVLTNTLQVLFQRLQYPLFLATAEFCHVITSNKYDIKLVQFGCHKCDEENEVIQALGRCLSLSSNFQVANLAYFVEICQRWLQHQIKYELDRKPLGRAETIYEDAAASIAMVFGKTIVGVPKSFVAQKIINSALPLIDDIRRLTLYFLLGIPPFEFWHLWSINTLCFEDKGRKCKSKRGAFMQLKPDMKSLETLPNL